MDLSTIKTQREKFAKSAEPFVATTSSDHNAYGGIIFDDDTLYVVGKWPCHGWLSEYNFGGLCTKGGKGKTPKYILSAVMCPRTTKKKLVGFLGWLLNRSVWKDMFLEKDPEQAVALGIVVDASFPANFIASGLMASRFLTEVYVSGMDRREVIYDELLRLGVSEDESFFFAHLYTPKDLKNIYPISFNRLSSGHSTFFSCGFGLSYCKNFLTGNFLKEKLNPPLNKKFGYTNSTVNGIWGKEDTKDPFGGLAKKLKPRREVLAKDHHIFRKAPEHSYMYNSPEDFLDVLQQMKEAVYA